VQVDAADTLSHLAVAKLLAVLADVAWLLLAVAAKHLLADVLTKLLLNRETVYLRVAS
jgi:hypothetical protein